ncbi:MAG: hypothetical protein SNJ82_06485 [Gemmataceae bacterium]
MSESELAVLLEAVRKSEEPAISLVLADWLEEFGDEAGRARAEYIRLDHRARHDAELSGQLWVEQRLAEIRGVYGPAWLGPLAALRGLTHWTLHRGLLWVWLRPAILKGDRLALVAMQARFVWLKVFRSGGWKRRDLRKLFAASSLKGISAIEILNSRGPTPVGTLMRNRAIEQLQRLRILHGALGDASLRRIAHSLEGGALHALELPFNRIGSPGLVWLARSRLLARLEVLNLEANRIGPRGLVALVRSPHLPKMHLKLAFNRVRGRGAERLAQLPGLARLRSLDLGWNGIGAAGLDRLRSSPYLQGHLVADGNGE